MKSACIIFLLLTASCTRGPYVQTNQQYKKQAKELARQLQKAPLADSMPEMGDWVGTINFGLRKPNLVIIHHTAQNSCEQTLRTFTLQRTQVSAHYVICRNGTVHHMLNDYLRAWHGGSARWGNINDINSSSIGIELDNNGAEPFAEAQMNSLLKLLQNLKNAYVIPTSNFIGHADIAPTRKTDPSHYFSWKQLSDKGFGHWYNDTANVVVPQAFNNIEALRIIGYDIRDSTASFHAFRLHFLSDTLQTMDSTAQKVLFSVYKKYL